ncbi:FtsK/SpoIIIE domain-containing protein [Amycolatopsis carbonis]|uniref:FtsK/SpoIIIE domain-containing protein n=1 Tax=Amycolatopsis carbonis TaxID=715471 RepID=A0A9Y2INS1_9PSEU|nr:FtsK/SpoIIIE domain-containing protein [Amycolatopsis sp. 2-15]WIX81718.1 FtsK/SpoIIIE domain-containing protein [Amycolatopsis sp. 2-15]
MKHPKSNRKVGSEFKGLKWTARHPGAVLAPAGLVASGIELGWSATGGVIGGTTLGLCAWYRAHPDTFDHYAAPRMRAWRRRWSTYFGPRFNRALRACDLYVVDRRTDEIRFPRVVKVRSHSPSVDTVTMEIPPGMGRRAFEDRLEILADALRVERIALERVKPGRVALVIERHEPFTDTIPAPDMPDESGAVDPGDVYIGETEYGTEWRQSILGKHIFIAGATGSGKNSIPLSLLRGLAPLIRDGLVRLWICDPKQMEFRKLAGIAHRYADEEGTCAELIHDFIEDIRRVQRDFAATGQRKITMSRETPLNLLIIDEIGALMAYGDGSIARTIRKDLAVAVSQGRATGHATMALVQEPTKDTVPVRDLFPIRICLRVTTQSHVDMVLGEGARLRGALADEIPEGEETAGIGFVIRPRSRVPQRVRSAYVADREIDDMVAFIARGLAGSPALTVVA